eukprot:TRINITY_DN26998_c0_g2_i1.p1 TRINITY_DN26998_c0_g2~~TRINITY_DN26998_c0_g2_i1.p1  ORF type:complete len:297 (-),score=44.81 TRINITY_DN26998_c0_g2_i1:69-959(-)
MFVTDQYNHRVLRMPKPGSDAQAIVVAGGWGPGDSLKHLHNPRGLAIEPETKALYIADSDNNRVLRWEWDAQEGEVVCGGNGPGDGLHQLKGPRSLLLEKSGALLIADVWNHRVLRWRPGEPSGELVAGGQGTGTKLGQIRWPYGLAHDADGVLYISDHMNNRVVRWPEGATEGEVVAGGRGKGIDPDQLDAPCGIVFDAFNKLLVCDAGNHRIMKFEMDSKGKFHEDGECVAGGNLAGYELYQLSWPHNISLDSLGRMLIADFQNHRVLRWVPGQDRGVIVAGGQGLGSGLHQIG